MAGNKIPGVLGTKTPSVRKQGGPVSPSPMGGVDLRAPVGADNAVPMQTITRTVVAVIKDWEPPGVRTTPAIVVRGNTLEQVGRALNELPEWGEAGGRLRAARIPAGTSEEVTVNLHANLHKRLPTWAQYTSASVAVKAEWDRMMVALERHEQHHVDIAIEEANNLATALIGVEISEIADSVTEANREMHDRQVKYDTDTNHGQDEGVTLDTSIT